MSETYKPGELFVYTNGDSWELGQVKNQASDTTYACYYSTGDTAARTPVANMHKLKNAGWSHVERAGGDNETAMSRVSENHWECFMCTAKIAVTKRGDEVIKPNYCSDCGRVVTTWD